MSGDLKWLEAHDELGALHLRKSATYGNQADPLANFTGTAMLLGKPPEYVVAARMIEKLIRAINMMDAGLADDVKEWPDLASLALCAEALRRRAID